MQNLILAHDLGTTGNKATLYDEKGQLVASTFHAYETHYPEVNWAEQDPDEWWTAVCRSTGELLSSTEAESGDIVAVSFSGQMMGCLPVDGEGRPLCPAIIWADQRSEEQAQMMAREVGEDEVYRITGHRVSPTYSGEKIMWIRDNRPRVYKRTAVFLQAKDYIISLLTGEYVTDYSDASGTNLLDIARREWSTPLLEASEIDRTRLPALRSSFDVAGTVTPQAASATGLASGTPVVVGGGDGVCAGVGAGAVSEGATYIYIGSSSWVAMTSGKPVLDGEKRIFNWVHMEPELYMPCGTMQSAGASYAWLRDEICRIEQRSAKELGVDVYELMNLQAQESPPGARDLLFLPYLMGERSPHWNPRARGAFIGLHQSHHRSDLIRAVLEGVSFNLRLIAECFGDHLSPKALRVIGGGARGNLWRQILSDMFDREILLPRFVGEGTSLGAAIAGMCGTGLLSDMEAASQLNPIVTRHTPDATAKTTYRRLFPLFREAYLRLESVYGQLAQGDDG